jgi:hypothetical protein
MAINNAKAHPIAGGETAVFVPPLAERAHLFHAAALAPGCACLEDGTYPCEECEGEIRDLTELLDDVAQDAIRITSEAWDRLR